MLVIFIGFQGHLNEDVEDVLTFLKKMLIKKCLDMRGMIL